MASKLTDKELTEEVLQKEWSYIKKGESKTRITTSNVNICTAFYGSDEDNNIAFMCHFDLPGSEKKALLDIFELINKNNISKNKLITCYLDGGYQYTYSQWVRNRIKKEIKKLNDAGWNIKLISLSYNKILHGKGVSYNLKTKTIAPYPIPPQYRKKRLKLNFFHLLFGSAKCSKGID